MWPAQPVNAIPKAVEHRVRQHDLAVSNAWDSGRQTSLPQAALAGVHLVKYDEAESIQLSLQVTAAGAHFVTCRIGPILADGEITKDGSVKLTGEWPAGVDLDWVIQGVPMREMAAKSPLGMVGCRFKLWAQSRVSRRWIGRTLPFSVPSAPHTVQIGGCEITFTGRRGGAAEAAIAHGARVIRAEVLGTLPSVSPLVGQQTQAESLGSEILRVIMARQWGVAAAMLNEVRRLPQEQRRRILGEVDRTRRTALRLCVDGQALDRPPLLQALERGSLIASLGTRRPYWWTMRIDSVCHRTLSFLGEVRIGVPKAPRLVPVARPWTAPAAVPAFDQCCWSEAQACRGKLEFSAGPHLGRLTMEDDTELSLCVAEPGESVPFGPGTFRNPLALQLLAAKGKIAGTLASGAFDAGTCARLACEREPCGAGDVARLAVSCNADPRALADDGLSPYTAALLGQDPCNLLEGLDPHLQMRMLRGDPLAWAEAGRGQTGDGHADLVAAPLTRNLPVPDEMAEALLEFCFKADLPLLAARVLGRIDGQQFLLTAIERAGNPQWLRVVEKILQPSHEDCPSWCDNQTLAYAISQVQLGRKHFRLLLDACLSRLRGSDDFYRHTAILPPGSGAECPICFEPLCKGVPVAFTDEDGRAVCPHFLCATCARGYEASASSTGAWRRCPECRRSAPKALPLPKLADDPLGWFDFLKSDSGTLARSTLLRAVSAMLPVEADVLGAAVDAGSITTGPVGQELTAAEFLTGGLYAWIWRHELEHRRCSSLGQRPDLAEREEWFRYWNITPRGGGVLTRGEALRAILRTFKASSLDKPRLEQLRKRFDRVWESCASARKARYGHCNPEVVSQEEFTCSGGLGDLLEEAFGDLDEGLPAQEGGPVAGFSSRSRPPGAPRRERVLAEVAAAVLATAARQPTASAPRGTQSSPGRGPATASGAATPRSATTGPGAGVLDLLDEAETLTGQQNEPTGAAVPCSPLQHVNSGAMEALERLERDLGLSEDRQIISL